MKYMEMLPADGPVVTSLTKKLAPPLGMCVLSVY